MQNQKVRIKVSNTPPCFTKSFFLRNDIGFTTYANANLCSLSCYFSPAKVRKSILSTNSKIRLYFDKQNPESLGTSLTPSYKLKIKIAFVFDRGLDFCILLDFSTHLLL